MEISSSASKISLYSTKQIENNLKTKQQASEEVQHEQQDVICWKCGTTDAMQNQKELPIYKRPLPVRPLANQASDNVITVNATPLQSDSAHADILTSTKELTRYSRFQNYMDKHPVTKRILSAYSNWTEQHITNGRTSKETFEKFLSSHPKAEHIAKEHNAFFDRFFSNPYYFNVFRKLEGI